jgi:hypothetical protein
MISTQEAGTEMRSRESLLALAAELEGDVTGLGRVLANNRRAWERIQGGASDTLDWGSLEEDIDPGKTREIQEIAGNFFADFPAIHESFAGRLREIAEALR